MLAFWVLNSSWRRSFIQILVAYLETVDSFHETVLEKVLQDGGIDVLLCSCEVVTPILALALILR